MFLFFNAFIPWADSLSIFIDQKLGWMQWAKFKNPSILWSSYPGIHSLHYTTGQTFIFNLIMKTLIFSTSLYRDHFIFLSSRKLQLPFFVVVVQWLSHVQLFVTPMDYSMLGFPVLHCLLEFAQIHVHWAIFLHILYVASVLQTAYISIENLSVAFRLVTCWYSGC